MRTLALLLLLPLATVGRAAGSRADLSWVQSWAIQLQGAKIDELVASTYDVVVIDYSRDGGASGEYTFNEIKRVRESGKVVLAYLSVGEAENYRFYWKKGWKSGKPSFLGPENPDWAGNFRAKYWLSGWWDLVLKPYLDRIMAAGFDGVFLDTVDSYWYWYEEGGQSLRTSANRMCQLVGKIATYTRGATWDGFVLCANNGVGLLEDAAATSANSYKAALDAADVESLFYDYWSEADQAYRLEMLRLFADAGKLLLNVEYIERSGIASYEALLATTEPALIGYPAYPDRLLDELYLP